MNTLRKFALTVAILLVTVSCYYGDPCATSSPGTPSSWSLVGFTPDGTDTLNVAGDFSHVDVTAPGDNHAANTRIGWVDDTSDFENEEVCATWESRTHDVVQPGLIVHFDGTHAITLTQNVYGPDRTQFNFHVWDLSQAVTSGSRFVLVGKFTATSVGDGRSWPLRACLRAVGPFIDGKVWPIGAPDPAYGDPAASGGVMVTDHPGRTGWYAGHVPASGRLTYSTLWTIHE